MKMLKHCSKERNVKITAIKRKMRNSTHTKLRECFTTVQTEEEVEMLSTNYVGTSRCKLANPKYHEKHTEPSRKLFGFVSHNDTLICVSSFFNKVKISFP